MKTKGIFITSTSTGIGKTQVACAIARWLRGLKKRVGVMKPIETGVSPLKYQEGSDAATLMRAVGLPPGELNRVCPCRFRLPLAPLFAARREGRRVDFRKIISAYEKQQANFDFWIIEGVGGIRVPITRKKDVIDLIHIFEFPVIMVSSAGLGTINHTAMTAEILRRNRVDLRGVIYVEKDVSRSDISRKNNPEWIKDLYHLPTLGMIHNRGGFDSLSEFERWDAMIEEMDTRCLLRILGKENEACET